MTGRIRWIGKGVVLSAAPRRWRYSGVIGNGAKIRSTILDGTPVLKYKVVVRDPRNGTSCRGLMMTSSAR